MRFPAHQSSLSLSHNEHRDNYEDFRDFIESDKSMMAAFESDAENGDVRESPLDLVGSAGLEPATSCL